MVVLKRLLSFPEFVIFFGFMDNSSQFSDASISSSSIKSSYAGKSALSIRRKEDCPRNTFCQRRVTESARTLQSSQHLAPPKHSETTCPPSHLQKRTGNQDVDTALGIISTSTPQPRPSCCPPSGQIWPAVDRQCQTGHILHLPQPQRHPRPAGPHRSAAEAAT